MGQYRRRLSAERTVRKEPELKIDLADIEAALRRAARNAVSGTREQRSGRFLRGSADFIDNRNGVSANGERTGRMGIDLERLTRQELRNLAENNAKRGQHETVRRVVAAMSRRGFAIKRDYLLLEWNQERVREVMQPFREIAAHVAGNGRTPYTDAGGSKIGRRKSDPEHYWIDSYSAIKTEHINASFACRIRSPGDEPEFRLRVDGGTPEIYNADSLPDLRLKWQQIADSAVE